MEDLVVSLSVARDLDAASWPAKTYFCWNSYREGDDYFHWQVEQYQGQPGALAAPGAEELATQLPTFSLRKFLEGGAIRSSAGGVGPYSSLTLANALAKLWLATQAGKP